MSDAPTPLDYDAEDGYNDEQGCEQCPHCEVIYSANSGYFDTVYGSDGTEYESNYAADPMDGPFFCKRCWPEIRANVRAAQNRGLDEFTGGDE